MSEVRSGVDRRDGWGPICSHHEAHELRTCALEGLVETLSARERAVSDSFITQTASIKTWAKAVVILQGLAAFLATGFWADYRINRSYLRQAEDKKTERLENIEKNLEVLASTGRENRALALYVFQKNGIPVPPGFPEEPRPLVGVP